MKVEVPKKKKKKEHQRNMGEYRANTLTSFFPKSLERLSQQKPRQNKRTKNTK